MYYILKSDSILLQCINIMTTVDCTKQSCFRSHACYFDENSRFTDSQKQVTKQVLPEGRRKLLPIRATRYRDQMEETIIQLAKGKRQLWKNHHQVCSAFRKSLPCSPGWHSKLTVSWIASEWNPQSSSLVNKLRDNPKKKRKYTPG